MKIKIHCISCGEELRTIDTNRESYDVVEVKPCPKCINDKCVGCAHRAVGEAVIDLIVGQKGGNDATAL